MNLNDLEYIYTNDLSETKHVGIIEGIEAKSILYFTVRIKKKRYPCILYKMFQEWHIEMPLQGISVDLSYPEDEFWNSECLINEIDDYDTGIAIACAVKKVYQKLRDAFN